MKKYNIRLGQVKDVPHILRMSYEAFKSNHFLSYSSKELTKEEEGRFTDYLIDGIISNMVFPVIAERSKPIGMMIIDLRLDVIKGWVAWEWLGYVESKYRGNNIFESMIKFGENIIKEKGIKFIFASSDFPNLMIRNNFEQIASIYYKEIL